MKIFAKHFRTWCRLLIFLSILLVTVLLFQCLPHVFTLVNDDKWLGHKKIATIDPWIKKHWNHVKIIASTSKRFQSTKKILLWTKFFGVTDYVPKLSTLGCPNLKCVVTSDRQYLNESHALIFHLRDISLNDMPNYRTDKQIWVLLHHEAPPHTPDILKYFSGLFNWTATYRSDSEISLTPLAKRKNSIFTVAMDQAKGKKRMVAWLVSNCNTPSHREDFVKELQKIIPVDIYGKCGLFSCMPVQSTECYEKLSSIYRFYLSFENSICKDYVTEKFFNILNTDMIPIVMGGANYSYVAPPSSYIDALSFKTPKDLADFLIDVAEDAQKFNSYFAWKNTHIITIDHYMCQICHKLQDPLTQPNYYKNISNWWFGDANCKAWTHSHDS